MARLKAWWANTSILGKVLSVAGGALILGLVVVTIIQAQTTSTLRSDLDAAQSAASGASEQAESTADELGVAQDQVSSAEQTLVKLEERVAELESDMAEANAQVEALAAEDSAALASAVKARDDAEQALTEAERLVVELTLAYSSEIGAARSRLASSFTAFACSWGAERATAEVSSSSLTSQGAANAFEDSDSYAALQDDPNVASYLRLASSLGEDQFGVEIEVIVARAVECWQAEDAKINAALYVYQGVLAEAALDAACTHGAAETYADSSISGYEATAVFNNWQLTLGYDDARSYLRAIEDRFGSIKEFLAIPDTQIQSESDRCDDVRDLIEPKRSGTWNVGDEILPGIWKAYDVSDCYWARLAENGDIRDNHFGDGLRLTVNVSSSDGQFEISGCRFYYANP